MKSSKQIREIHIQQMIVTIPKTKICIINYIFFFLISKKLIENRLDVVEGVQVIEYENIESQAKTKVIM